MDDILAIWGKNDARERANRIITPWGEAQGEPEIIAEGMSFVTTAGHGGLVLSPDRWLSLPEDVRESLQDPMFAEEDCEAVIVLALLGLEMERNHLERAIRVAGRFEKYAPALPHLEALREIQVREARAA